MLTFQEANTAPHITSFPRLGLFLARAYMHAAKRQRKRSSASVSRGARVHNRQAMTVWRNFVGQELQTRQAEEIMHWRDKWKVAPLPLLISPSPVRRL